MVAKKDMGNILETVKEGKDKMLKFEGTETGRMASASANKQPERLLENSVALTNKIIARLGYIFMTGYYLRVRENQITAVYQTIHTRGVEVG